MMRIFLATILVSASLLSQAQTPEKEAQKAIEQFFEGLSQKNEKIIRENITADFLLLEHGELWNTDTLVSRITGVKPKGYHRDNYFVFIRTEITGNQAWVAYHNTAQITANDKKGKIEWLESAVLVKQGDRWLIKMLHSTFLAQKKD